jgi:tetratricopeptide (TPR) repeat protein
MFRGFKLFKAAVWSLLVISCASARAADPDKIAKARAEAEVYAQRSLEAAKRPPKKLSEPEQKAEDMMDRANAIISESENPTQIMPAVRLYQEAVKTAPGYDKAWWGLAMALWGKAMLMPRESREEKSAVFAVLAQARDACNQALKIDPNSAGGNYWLSNIMLTESSLKNIVQQAVILPEVFKLNDKVAAVDPYFEHGAIFRSFAIVLVTVPEWLSKSVGYEPEVIIPYLDKAIELEPKYFANYVYRAQVYHKLNDRPSNEKALKDLDYVLVHDPDALKGYGRENRAQQRDARAFWNQMTGRDYPAR